MELLLGSVAGASGVMVSHPLDTIRTRQVVDRRGAKIIAQEMLKKFGARGMYRGIYSPLCSVSLWKGTVLGLQHRMMDMVRLRRGLGSGAELPLSVVAGTSCVAGGVGAALISPMELVKARTQLSGSSASNIGLELVQVLKVARQGVLAGLGRGMPLLFCRDVPGAACFIGSYEVCKRYTQPHLPALASAFVCGSIAGPMGWIFCYPVEATRIKYQCDPAFTTYKETIMHIYRDGGLRAFFRGCGTCCVRSSIQVGTTMMVFEKLKAACD